MKPTSCKKCGSMQHTIKYHVSIPTNTTLDTRWPQCNELDFVQSAKEHLHFYCECGNQWTSETCDTGNHIYDDIFNESEKAKWIDELQSEIVELKARIKELSQNMV